MKQIRQTFIFIFVISLTSLVHAEEKVRHLGAIGDSMTAGAIANMHLGARLRFSTFRRAIRFLGNFEYPSDIRHTRPVENQELSWATGDHYTSRSHYSRLNRMYPGLKQINYGISGAKAKHLFKEHIDNFMDESLQKFGVQVPDYVTYLIGGNDMCADTVDGITSEDDFYDYNRANLFKLMSANPEAKILISSLPLVDNLKKKMSNVKVFKTGHPVMKNYKCKNTWAAANFCQSLTTPQSPENEQIVSSRIRAYNDILEELSEDLNRAYPGQVKYSKAFAEEDFKPHHLSVDCFHPSLDGQNLLADKTWLEGFWGQ